MCKVVQEGDVLTSHCCSKLMIFSFYPLILNVTLLEIVKINIKTRIYLFFAHRLSGEMTVSTQVKLFSLLLFSLVFIFSFLFSFQHFSVCCRHDLIIDLSSRKYFSYMYFTYMTPMRSYIIKQILEYA